MINFPKIIVERLTGTAGGDNHLVKKGESPFDPNLPPPQPPTDVGDTYEFSTINNGQDTGSLHIAVGIITSTASNWTIMDSDTGELLANHLGAVTEGVTIHSEPHPLGKADMIIISQPGFPSRQYTMRGDMFLVAISTQQPVSAPMQTSSVTVHHYSNRIKQYMFPIINAKLILPDHLPSHITSTESMFENCNLFNQDIGNWNTSNIIDMSDMFNGATLFNKDISRWKVRNVRKMEFMFFNASSFNQDLSPWCVSRISSLPASFDSGANVWSKLRPRWGTCPEDDLVEPPYVPPVEEEVDDETVIKGFDFAVMRYRWLPSGGRDLDTRTYITTPDRSNRKVGWTRLKNDNSYLIWNEDNTGTGVESVLIDIGKIIIDYPAESIINIKMDAFWYNSLGDGKLYLEFVTFKGGQMVVSGYDWINIGGLAIQILTLPVDTLVNRSEDIDGENLATLSYDTSLKTGTLVARDGPSIPLPGDGGEVTPPPVGGGNGPGGSVIPTNPVYPNGMQGFTFSVETYNNEGGVTPFELNLSNVTSGWALYDGNVQILSATQSHPKVTATTSGRDISLSFNLGVNVIKTFTLVGTMFDAVFYTPSTGYVGQEFTINRFSANIENHVFNVRNANLVVPSQLPTYLTSARRMFYGALRFNQDISRWDTSRITNMADMFNQAEAFSQNIGNWNVSNVTDMNSMFNNADKFNQDISQWDVSKVTDMNNMFNNATYFNQDLSRWCVTNLTSEPYNFKYNANSFWTLYQPVWGTCPEILVVIPDDGLLVELTKLLPGYYPQAGSDVYLVRNTENPWQLHNANTGELLCDQDGVYNTEVILDKGDPYSTYIKLKIGEPLTVLMSGELTDVRIIVDAAEAYSTDMNVYGRVNIIKYPPMLRILKHKVYGYELTVPTTIPATLTNMTEGFYQSNLFNQDISMWDVSKVTDMNYMFSDCKRFNQDLSSWNVRHIPWEPSNFTSSNNVWTLPKPIWGEIDIVPVGGFIFDVDTTGQDAERTFYITLQSGEACEIYRDGVIAYSTIFNDPMVESSVIWPNNKITITVPVGTTQTFTVVPTVPLSRLELSVIDTPSTVAMITVKEFAVDIANFKFLTYYWNLVVACLLPAQVTSTFGMFLQCHSFNSDISGWDMGNVTNTGYMFSGCSSFNQDISTWNVSNVTNMNGMFYSAVSFNQDLSGWDVTQIPSTPSSFSDFVDGWSLPKPVWGGAPPAVELPTDGFIFEVDNSTFSTNMAFSVEGYDTYDWTISKDGVEIYSYNYAAPGVTSTDNGMYHTVYLTVPANTSAIYRIGGTVAAVTLKTNEYNSLKSIFNVSRFSDTIDKHYFKVYASELTVPTTLPANITTLDSMFNGAWKFNQDISMWDVSGITNMSSMFANARSFNKNISLWDVSNVTNMGGMFYMAEVFNQDLSNWNTGLVENMSQLFYNASRFNGDISTWDTGRVTNMSNMFYGTSAFNSNISSWNVSNVLNMASMFESSTMFNQDLSLWCVTNISSAPIYFADGAVSYVLPKPVWGTCPQNAPEEVLPGSMKISFEPRLTTDQSLYLYMRYTSPTPWEVRDSVTGELIASHTGATDSHTTVELFETGMNAAEITINHPGLTERFYSISGDMHKLFIEYYSDNDSRAVGSGTPVEAILNVYKYSDTIGFSGYSVGYAELNIPTTPPIGLTTTEYMFYGCYLFNQDLSNWDVSAVTTMSNMFSGATSFNRDISTWNTSSVTDMSEMFYDASYFNQNLNGWDVSQVTSLFNMFGYCTAYNQPMNNWNTSKVVNISWLFEECHIFNQDISMWDVGQVTNFRGMFDTCVSFNQDIGNWNTGNVTSNATSMSRMFFDAKAFNQDLSRWDVSRVPREPSNFATGTTVWTLPKPGWNRSTHTEFTVSGYDTPDAVTAITIAMYSPSSGWSLTDAQGTLLVNAAGSLHNDVTISYSPDGKATWLHLFYHRNVTKSYVLNAVTSYVEVTGRPSADNSMIGEINVTEMGNGVDRFYFKIANHHLNIPAQLPLSVTNTSDMFWTSKNINPDLRHWDTGNIKDMSGMFRDCGMFNQDLSGWCVNLIALEPVNFASNASSWVLPKPVWGTCPPPPNTGSWSLDSSSQNGSSVTLNASKQLTTTTARASLVRSLSDEDITNAIKSGDFNELTKNVLRDMSSIDNITWSIDDVNSTIIYNPVSQ